MAWTTPKRWSQSEDLTHTDMNTYMKDNVIFLHEALGDMVDSTGHAMSQTVALSKTDTVVKQVVTGGIVQYWFNYTITSSGTANGGFLLAYPEPPSLVSGEDVVVGFGHVRNSGTVYNLTYLNWNGFIRGVVNGGKRFHGNGPSLQFLSGDLIYGYLVYPKA